MGRCLIKLADYEKSTNYYLTWSSVVDAPIDYGVETLEELKQNVLQRRIRDCIADFFQEWPELERRLHGSGTTSLGDRNVDEIIDHNRAGYRERTLTKEEIVEYYCRRQEHPGDSEFPPERPGVHCSPDVCDCAEVDES